MLGVMALACAAPTFHACDHGPTEESDTAPTRFDDLREGPPVKRVSKTARARAVARAQRDLESGLDKALTLSVGSALTQMPESMAAARDLGTAVGTVKRKGKVMTLVLSDPKGVELATVKPPPLETQSCWSMAWEPEWTPDLLTGPGLGWQGKAELVWWRFDDGDNPPVLVRFGPDGVAILRKSETDDCYVGESLLGLVGGALRTVDYLSPFAMTDGADPDETEQTRGSKPLKIDILPPRGKETLSAKNGTVEIRDRRRKKLLQWKSTLPKKFTKCSQAAYHRFERKPPLVFFEAEFTDNRECDEAWTRREVQQALYALEGSNLINVLSGGVVTSGDDDASTTKTDLDIVIGAGSGRLRYVGKGEATTSEAGGEKIYDCATWAIDQGLDAADTGFTVEEHEGVWTFELEDEVVPVGNVSVSVRTYQCVEAL